MPHAKKSNALPDQLKAARKKLGLSQSQAAAAWRVNVRTLQDWEIGRREPRGFARNQLSELLAGILAGKRAERGRGKSGRS